MYINGRIENFQKSAPCLNIYNQDFPHSLIHFGQSVSEQRCET